MVDLKSFNLLTYFKLLLLMFLDKILKKNKRKIKIVPNNKVVRNVDKFYIHRKTGSYDSFSTRYPLFIK